MWLQTRRKSKYRNVRITTLGHRFDSKKEAEFAMWLESEKQAGRIKSWRRQVPIELRINGGLWSTYKMDFVTTDSRGNEKWFEIKGFPTEAWRLRWKALDLLFPDQDKEVVR
jgi:hypothetical protein